MIKKLIAALLITTASINAMELSKSYSIRDYLISRPVLINQRMTDQMLDLSNLGINNLDGLQDIPDIEKMGEINLSFNNLTRIPKDSFYGLTQLQILHLEDNAISTIEPLGFNGLKNLKILNLENNKLTRIDIAFSRLFSLQGLYLTNNAIADIKPYAFRDQKNLLYLWLDKNKLTSISLEPFKKDEKTIGLQTLKILSLEGNPLHLTEEQEAEIKNAFPETSVIF